MSTVSANRDNGGSWLRRWYGSGPAHLVAITLGGLVGIYAGSKLLESDPKGVIVWFVAAAVLHDLVLVPAYTALDRAARLPVAASSDGPSERSSGVSGSSSDGRSRTPFWYDHIRVPVLLSGLLGLVFFPLILSIPKGFEGITGTSVDVYLGRYLAMIAGLFVVSALALLVRVGMRRRQWRHAA